MNTAQLHDQRLRPAQETEIEKAEPLLFFQQTSIDHNTDVWIDSSRLVMDNGNSPVGFIEDNFTRLTRRMVFEFLGGHARMEELPCLGDMGVLDCLCESVKNSECYQNTFENISNLLDTFDASSTTFISSPEHFRSKNSTSTGDSISSAAFINREHSCNDKFVDSNKLATISTAESSPTCSIPDPKQLNEFLYGNLKFQMFLASELPDGKLDTFDYPSLHEDSDSVDDRDVENLSDSKFNVQLNDRNRNYDKGTSDIPGVLIGLGDGLLNGEHKEMEISNSSNTELLVTHWPTVMDVSSFDVSDHEELLESYGLNNQDEYNDVDYICESPIWPGKMDVSWNEMNQMKSTDSASNENPLSSYENSKNSVSSTCRKQEECTLTTFLFDVILEDYLSQGHPCNDGFQNSIEEPILGTTETPLVYAIPDPDVLEDFLFGNLDSPTFLAAELQDKKVDIPDSLFGACYLDDCADVASSLDNCKVELLDSECSSKDPSAFPFDVSDHYKLLETYGMNIQDQYTNTGYTCPSPTWPGKTITVSRGQTQKTCLIPNLTNDGNANGTLTADSSLFHSNTDGIAVMNKKSTNKCYEENSENSVSLCPLNQVECDFKTSFFPIDDSTNCVHPCSDDFGDSIEHQSLEIDENELKFAFPDPKTLKDFFFGSLDSPRFLASELLDGKIDNLDYPSLLGDCGQNDRTEEADLSDKIFKQCYDNDNDENSINKFTILDKCSVELLGLNLSPFDISDQDELLEWYGINDQDQFIDGNWTCDSPTWPGKI